MAAEERHLKEIEDLLGKDDTKDLYARLKGMHDQGSSSSELQEEVIRTTKAKDPNFKSTIALTAAAVAIATRNN